MSSMLAIGLMSGTSLDGVDCSLIETDGVNLIKYRENVYFPYEPEFHSKLRNLLDNYTPWLLVEKELTNYHAWCVKNIITKANIKPENVEVIGFHGQTIYHSKEQNVTWQIGNPHQLAALTTIKVVSDFRRKDMAYGGQGAPLIPIYHKAITNKYSYPVAIINIGGVSNITYITNEELIAFDMGPGNALINDMMFKYYKKFYDDGGIIAATGKIYTEIIEQLLKHHFFNQTPPKSLNRDEFIGYYDLVKDLKREDIITTLTKFTVDAIIHSLKFLPSIPEEIYICGGGVKNHTMMKWLSSSFKQKFGILKVTSIKELGLDPDFIESQGFAYLAARYLKGLPSSFSSTTLASKNIIAGVLFTP